jgi:DNA polymerase III epsilon subunit-like protein
MIYHILDTETASLRGGVCEIAWLKVDKNLEILEEFVSLVDPECEIEQGAMQIHGIAQEDVYGKPTMSDIAKLLPKSINLIGHNCQFDYRMITPVIEVDTQICTLNLARTFLKTVTNHKLETLQKELELSVQDSHSALGDVKTCRELLLHLMKNFDVSLDNLLARQGIPTMLHTMPFGKHKGKTISNIAQDYRNWLLTQNIDKDLRYTLEKLKGI